MRALTTHRGPGPAPPAAWRAVAVIASAGAAAVHLGAARAHLIEYVPAGLFMLAAGFAQLVWAVWVARGAPPRVLLAGLAGNLGIAVLWVVSRTAGLPVGAEPGMPEHIHGPDVLATALEVLIVLAALTLIVGWRNVPLPPPRSLAVMGALATVIVTGDDPGAERLVAAATLLAAYGCTRRRRSHAIVTHVHRARAGLGVVARAAHGTE